MSHPEPHQHHAYPQPGAAIGGCQVVHHHHYYGPVALDPRVSEMVHALNQLRIQEIANMVKLADLQEAVASNTQTVTTAVALLNAQHEQMQDIQQKLEEYADNGNDADLEAVIAQMKSATENLGTAIAAVAPPAQPPVEEPAPETPVEPTPVEPAPVEPGTEPDPNASNG